MTETLHSELELDAAAKHYMAVGMVAGTWAAFELQIDNRALELAKIPYDPGNCFTSQIMGSANKLNAYIAIAQLRGAKRTIGELETFAKDTVAMSERRNRTVHDPPTPKVVKLSTEIVAHIQRFKTIDSKVKAEVSA